MVNYSNDRKSISVEDTSLKTPAGEDTIAVLSTRDREAEISQLTWAVLDGKASLAERMRLAELVNAQHKG